MSQKEKITTKIRYASQEEAQLVSKVAEISGFDVPSYVLACVRLSSKKIMSELVAQQEERTSDDTETI